MAEYVKFNYNGKIRMLRRGLPFRVGDYVEITNTGSQYSSFRRAFVFFWGNCRNTYLTDVHKSEYWKVINIALHPTSAEIIYHIRNKKGENAVIGYDGIAKTSFHKKNRENLRDIVIYQLPNYGVEIKVHDWRDKLWDFYEDGKIVKNERRNNEII